MDEFLLRALLAGIAVALLAGPLGVFLVWRRLAYFGDTLSHSAIFGVALGFLFSINIQIGILLSTITVALFLILSSKQRQIATDTLLGIMAHSMLSFGLILISFVQGVRVDIQAWLFGDILSVSWSELAYIGISMVLVLGLLLWIWKPLLSLTVHEELAQVEGVNVSLISAVYTLLIAVLVAMAMKIIGALLITSLLIIPAAAARPFSRTPEQMALFAILIGSFSVLAGLAASLIWDTPAGPSIVAATSVLFLLSRLTRQPG